MRASRANVSLAVLVFILTAVLASAQPLEIHDPYDRMDEWRQGFLRFLDKHPNLTGDQLLAIQDLVDIDDADAFVPYLDAKNQNLLAERLQALSRVLPERDYLRLVRSFGDLRIWLVANKLVTQAQAALPDCNCTYNHHCQSNSCRDVACEPKGTTHTGVCAPVSSGTDPSEVPGSGSDSDG